MRVDRFTKHLVERLASQPGVASVEEVQVPGSSTSEVRLTCTDGSVFSLRVVRSSPGGENYSQPEKIITKDGRITARS